MKKIYIIISVLAIFVSCNSYSQNKLDSKQFYTEYIEPLDGVSSEIACGIIEDASTLNRLNIELQERVDYYKENGLTYPNQTFVFLVDNHFIKEFSDIAERFEIRKNSMPKSYYNKMMNELKSSIKTAEWLRAEYVKAINQ